MFRWSGTARAGLPPMQRSARIRPSPGSRISSASVVVGISSKSCRSPRKRDSGPLPQLSRGGRSSDGIAWAGRGNGGESTPGFEIRSPSRLCRPQTVLRQQIRCSARQGCGAMSGPVPDDA